MSGPPTDLKARVLEAARATPSPTRRASQRSLWLVLPASVLIGAALFFAFHGMEHGQGRSSGFYIACMVGWAGVAAIATWAALGRGGSATGRTRTWLVAVACGTPALLFAMMFGLAAAYPDVTSLHTGPRGFRCLGLTLAAAAFPLVALLGIRRGSDPVHPTATGAALGAACGAAAGVMVEMWCPVSAPSHVALGHILPIVVLAVLGAALGRGVLAIRPVHRGPPR
jgi:hypothetical protein